MPKLSDLVDTDYLPAQEPKRVYIYGKDNPDDTVDQQPSPTSSKIDKILNSLFRDDDQRYQLWPEKAIREGLTAAGDAMNEGSLPSGLRREDFTDIPPPMAGTKADVPGMFSGLAQKIGIAPVAWSPSDKTIEKAQAISALAGTGGLGGLGGVTDATLGATPFLRPALKYKDRLYKGKEGQGHQDVIPDALYPEFQKMAMSGEDISHYNFGFVNDKGHFLNREDALKYGIDTGLIDPQAGKFGALTSTLMADSSKPGTAIEAMAKAEPFYSALEHNVGKISQSKMTGEQWLGTLSNKPGVKPEEMQWTGLSEFLKNNGNKPVTKAQIEEHLAGNKVELVEKTSHTPNPRLKEMMDNDAQARILESNGDIEGARALWDKNKAIPSTGDFNPRYKDYQLPGGENYREMLLTLPRKDMNLKNKWSDLTEAEKVKITKDHKEFMDDMKGDDFFDNDPSMKSSHDPKTWYEEVIAPSLPDIQKQKVDMGNTYKSSHWDEPNILAHVRMNDRIIDGKKSLHLEEIQSDWHQQGRDKGYSNPKVAEKAKNIMDEMYKHRLGSQEYEDLSKQLNRLENNPSGVPDAPFKKSWHELALKRMIREAAEKGYARLSWTPGEAQVARYDLSKSVDKLQYNPDTQKLLGHKGNSLVVDQKVTPDKLADFVGKEAADKILNKPTAKIESPNNKGTFNHYLEGQDLKIGGEGMKGFYDQIIPKALEKLGKEHGVKVKQAKLTEHEAYIGQGRDGPETIPKKENTVHYIDIPQSMRDTAIGKGFPLFSSTHMFTPVNHEPEFKNK